MNNSGVRVNFAGQGGLVVGVSVFAWQVVRVSSVYSY